MKTHSPPLPSAPAPSPARTAPRREPPAPPLPPLPDRALTIAEPWAWLIVSDFVKPGFPVKSVENRSWALPAGMIGQTVAVHASSSWDILFNDDVDAFLQELHPAISAQMNRPPIDGHPMQAKKGLQPSLAVHPGCILGVVNIVGCVHHADDGADFRRECLAAGFGDWYDAQPIPPAAWAQPGAFCFLLDSPRQFVCPIETKGALNFWKVAGKPGLPAKIAAALRAPLGDPLDYRRRIMGAAKDRPAKK